MIKVKQYDGQVLSERLKSLSDALVDSDQGADTFVLLRDETGRLIKMIMNFTPPMGPGGRAAGAKQAGLNAVKRELVSLFSEATPELIQEVTEKHGLYNIHAFTSSSSGDKIPLEWRIVDKGGDHLPGLHRQFRNTRGKIDKQ